VKMIMTLPVSTMSRLEQVAAMIYAQLQAVRGANETTIEDDMRLACLALDKAKALLVLFEMESDSDRFTALPS